MRRRLWHPQTGLLLGSLGKLTGPLLPAGTLESRFHLVCTTSSEVCQITLTDQPHPTPPPSSRKRWDKALS